MVLENLGKSLNIILKKMFKSNIVDKDIIEELIKDIQRALLTADVDVGLVMSISQEVREKALDEQLPRGLSRKEHIVNIIWNVLTQYLGEKTVSLKIEPCKSNIIMMIGVQGSGKTTTIGKLARYYQKLGFRVGVVCLDTFRLGAYDQLKQLSEKYNISFYGDEFNKNVIDLANKGITKMIENKMEIIFLDTSGRHSKEDVLMEEMQNLSKVIKPKEIILIIDGTIGKQAKVQAEAFNKATNIGSIIITKLDGNAKGGGVLSAVASTKVPIKFIGTGEGMNAIEIFEPKKFVGSLIGIPDIEGLIRKFKTIKADDVELNKKILSGDFSLLNMMAQIDRIKKVGTIDKIFSMLGIKYSLPDGLDAINEEKIKRWKIIMNSMTNEELKNPKIIKASRKSRISHGAGVLDSDVKELLDQYVQMKKIVKITKRQRDKRLKIGV